jgi:hypothetical protein
MRADADQVELIPVAGLPPGTRADADAAEGFDVRPARSISAAG